MIGYRKQIYIYEHIYNIRTSSGQRQLLSSIVRRLATLLVAEKHANQEQQARIRKRLFRDFYKNSKRTHTPLALRKVYRKPRGRGCFTAAVGSEVETEGCFVEPEEPVIRDTVLPGNRRRY